EVRNICKNSSDISSCRGWVYITFRFVRMVSWSNGGTGIACNVQILVVEAGRWVIANAAMDADDFSVENVKLVLVMIQISLNGLLYSGIMEDLNIVYFQQGKDNIIIEVLFC